MLTERGVAMAALQEKVDALERESWRQRDAMTATVAAFDAERGVLRQEIALHEQAVAARQSFRWWLSLPLHRLRLWLHGR